MSSAAAASASAQRIYTYLSQMSLSTTLVEIEGVETEEVEVYTAWL
jgi:hypothetical protein